MVTENVLIIVAVMVGAFLIHRMQIAIRQYWKFSGKMLVSCPENKKSEAVEVSAGRAALAAFFGGQNVGLKACSRWPECKDCGQGCLEELAHDPHHHQVWNIVTEWFADKKCVYCRKPIVDLHHYDHRPALLNLQGKTIEWDDVRPQDLPEMLASCLPVCWNCHIVESFRHEHADLVIERPWRH